MVRSILVACSDVDFSYAEVGATFSDDPRPSGYHINRYRRFLGHGEKRYQSAIHALSQGVMYRLSFAHPVFSHEREFCDQGVTLAVVARHFGIWSVNPVRIVYRGERRTGEARLFSLAAGTLCGHQECGEERFSIRFSDTEVWYELFSFYKPSHVLLKAIFPLIKLVLNRFNRESSQAVADFCDMVRISYRFS